MALNKVPPIGTKIYYQAVPYDRKIFGIVVTKPIDKPDYINVVWAVWEDSRRIQCAGFEDCHLAKGNNKPSWM